MGECICAYESRILIKLKYTNLTVATMYFDGSIGKTPTTLVGKFPWFLFTSEVLGCIFNNFVGGIGDDIFYFQNCISVLGSRPIFSLFFVIFILPHFHLMLLSVNSFIMHRCLLLADKLFDCKMFEQQDT